MTTDPSRVELLLPNDDRLIPAVDAVVAHAGGRAGLSRQEQAELAHAATEACEETFSIALRAGNPNPIAHVVISDFPNRVEVSIEDAGPAGHRGSGHGGGEKSNEPDPVTAALQGMRVDRLHHEIHEGRPRTTLVKYHGSAIAGRDR